MASAAITLDPRPCTIESDSTGAVITTSSLIGMLINHGPQDVYLKVSVDELTAAAVADIATTLAQAQAQIPLPAGAALRVPRHFRTIAHKTVAGTAALSWSPNWDLEC